MSTKQELHPAREMLAAFGLGKLQPAEAAVVETHIAECEECCETLHDLGNDTFADLVRESDGLQLDPVADDQTIGLHESTSETGSDLPSELTKHPPYRILELLGKGGMGNVYKAEHTLMNREVALKVINRELVQNTQAVERFRREVQSAAQLAHSNIVTAHDAERAGDMHFLVMEYVAGDNLSDIVKRDGPLDVAQACDYIRQAADGLQHAHEKGMIHRDVKPHNLMVTSHGRVKILDFGLATLTAGALPNEERNEASLRDTEHGSSPTLTSAGSMMGTPDFISPEQATDARAADIRSDIYSLGCTFYYLLTGRPPFTEGSALERVKAHQEAEPRPIKNVRADIPDEVADVVRRMMAKDPADRFQTPADVADALAPFVDAYRTVSAPANVESDSVISTASSRRWWPPTVVQSLTFGAFALVLGAIVYVTTDGGTLVVESEDASVQIAIRPLTEESRAGNENDAAWEYRIDDTVTGSSVKWLRSGEYVVRLQGSENDFQLSQDQFVLKRGTRVVVRVTRRKNIDTSVRLGAIGDVTGAPAPNGQFLSLVDWSTGDLAVREAATGEIRRLTKKGTWVDSSNALWSVVSPDSQRVAYSWFTNKGYYYELRTVSIDGGEPEILYSKPEVMMMQPHQWSADGRHILVLYQEDPDNNRIALVSVEDGSLRVLKDVGKRSPIKMSMSSDNRYVVYDLRKDSSSSNRDIYLLDTVEHREALLVDHPGTDYGPIWTPDGERIVFFSDRSGSISLYILGVTTGRAQGEPKLVRQDLNRRVPMGFTDDASLYCQFTTGLSDVYEAAIDTSSATIDAPPTKVTRNFEGFNASPSWSHDGNRLAFVAFRGPVPAMSPNSGVRPDTGVLVVRSADTGEEQELAALLSAMSHTAGNGGTPPLRWSPNSQSIMVHAVDLNGERGLYRVDVTSKEVAPIVLESQARRRIGWADWSGDRTVVYYARLGVSGGEQVIVKRELDSGQENVLWRPSNGKPFGLVSLGVSPDGKTLAFARKLDGDTVIELMPIAGGDSRELVRLPGPGAIYSKAGIVWDPDGQSLLFGTPKNKAVRQHAAALWRIRVDADEPQELGLEIDQLFHFSIHPDGKRIAYSAGNRTNEVSVLENFLP